MKNVAETIASQYGNSPSILTLIEAMNQYIDPTVDLDQFYNFVWNVDTAVGFGLDIWGRIVGVDRVLQIPGSFLYLGFTGQIEAEPFNQAPFYSGPPDTQAFTLSDDAYRTLILTKALSNISAATAPSLNTLLSGLFANRGRSYVRDLGGMAMQFQFEFALQPFELAVLTQSGAVPRPAGVAATIVQFDAEHTFGFSEMGGVIAPFDQGVFFNPAISTIPIS